MDCRGQAIGDDASFYADSDFDSVSIQDRREEHNHPRLCGIFCGRLRLFVVGVRFDLSWIAYHEQHPDDELLPDEDEEQLLAALVAISTGVEDASVLGVPEEVGQKLLACYDELGQE